MSTFEILVTLIGETLRETNENDCFNDIKL